MEENAPWSHEVLLPKHAFEGTQDLWLTIRTMIIKRQTAFTCSILVIDILIEVNKLGVVDLEVVRAKEETRRLCSSTAI